MVRGARGGLSVRPGALFGLARNDRLAARSPEIATEIVTEIVTELAAAQTEAGRTGKPARRFKDFTWSTRHSWSRSGRVVAKVEWTRGEANPRFVVTSLVRTEAKARRLYEKLYCARGAMENRIPEAELVGAQGV